MRRDDEDRKVQQRVARFRSLMGQLPKRFAFVMQVDCNGYTLLYSALSG